MTQSLRCPALLLLLCSAWMSVAQDYEIKIARPAKAGLKYNVTVSGSTKQAQTVKMNGQVAQQEQRAFTVALEADVVVLTVTEKGQPRNVEYTIRQFTRTDADKTTELLPAGKVVVVDRDKENAPPFSLKDGGALDQPALEALDVVISEAKKDSVDDDLVFGTKERKAVGAEWPMNSELASADMAKHGVKVTKEDLTGTVKLNGVEQVNGMECLQLSMSVAARNVDLPMPEGFKVEKSTLKALAVGKFPVDTTQPKQIFSAQMEMSAVAKGGKPDQEVIVEIQMERSAEEKRVFAK